MKLIFLSQNISIHYHTQKQKKKKRDKRYKREQINHNIYIMLSPVNNEMCFIHNDGFDTIFKLCCLQELNDILIAYKGLQVSKN